MVLIINYWIRKHNILIIFALFVYLVTRFLYGLYFYNPYSLGTLLRLSK